MGGRGSSSGRSAAPGSGSGQVQQESAKKVEIIERVQQSAPVSQRHEHPATKEDLQEHNRWRNDKINQVRAVAQESKAKTSVDRGAVTDEATIWRENMKKPEAESIAAKIPKEPGVKVAVAYDELAETYNVRVHIS